MKRFAIKLLLFLLAGAIINVAVAWGCAVAFRSNSKIEREATKFEDFVTWSAVVRSRRVETVVFSSRTRGYHGSIDLRTINAAALHPREILPSWAPFRVPSHDFESATDVGAIEIQLTVARGFPMLALRSERAGIGSINGYPSLSLVHGIQTSLAWPSPGTAGTSLDLPTMPIWPGFAINTIFYAAIVWMLFAVPGAVRRRVRIKRGQCASCGYSLRGNLSDRCPECSAAVNARG